MPLHLLPKKSWHVYNAESIARVKRDEAAAQAREEALEQAQQEVDSARRLALLRGDEIPQHLQQSGLESEENGHQHPDLPNEDVGESEARLAPPRKRRRRHDEDDTQAEMRFAREDLAAGEAARAKLQVGRDNRGVGADVPLVDDAGHLQLFSAPKKDDKTKERSKRESSRKGKTKETEQEEEEGMRLRDAAGRGASGNPWYTSATAAAGTNLSSSVEKSGSNAVVLAALAEKDVWGNEDPRRRERESQRLATGDPFAAMQSAQRQLKQSTHDREKWQRQRMAVLDAEEEERRRRQRHRHGSRRQRHESGRNVDKSDDEDLEGFSLDASPQDKRPKDDHHRSHHHRHHHHREMKRRRRRSHSRSRERHTYREQRPISTA